MEIRKTHRASLASSRAFLPKTFVNASAKISLPDWYFKVMPCSVNCDRRAAARTQKCRFRHVVTVCNMLAIQPVLSDKSSTLRVPLPMSNGSKLRIAIVDTQPKPAAWISASTALCAASVCLTLDRWTNRPFSMATTPERLLSPPGAKLASALTMSWNSETGTASPRNVSL